MFPVLGIPAPGLEARMLLWRTHRQRKPSGFFVSAAWQLLMSGSCGEPQGSPVSKVAGLLTRMVRSPF